ncbi:MULTISPECIES: hypothetical protein [unclassified Pseudomonas]|uniref:hypothetical protein n=1 Tax=unclassified Pseudomonas TaxID=196821 RepID=UPI001CE0F9AC|nr:MULTISPECIES: hypothetical protein [unclassified Pseudomonas]
MRVEGQVNALQLPGAINAEVLSMTAGIGLLKHLPQRPDAARGDVPRAGLQQGVAFRFDDGPVGMNVRLIRQKPSALADDAAVERLLVEPDHTGPIIVADQLSALITLGELTSVVGVGQAFNGA